jgi:ribose/xylose/arabinose/galactoside ABC-type transport system permease subunit
MRVPGLGERERAAAFVLCALLAVLAIAAPTFFSPDNLRDIMMANAAVQIIALGMTLVVLTGEVDVSVGATFAICAVVAGTLAREGIGMPAAITVAIATGALVGLVNGTLVGVMGLPSIVVTLAMLAILRDGLRWMTEGAWVRELPAEFQWFGLGQRTGRLTIIACTLVLIVLVAWVLRRVAAGRAVYATGSDRESAHLVGLSPRTVIVATFVACGVLTGLAAVLNAVRFAEVQGAVIGGLELKVIAAVIVGGVAIRGGRGSIIGAVLGVALLGTIGTGLTFLGISAYWERALQGAIILAAIAGDRVTAARTRLGA